jgi:hypothetical protein
MEFVCHGFVTIISRYQPSPGALHWTLKLFSVVTSPSTNTMASKAAHLCRFGDNMKHILTFAAATSPCAHHV